MSVAVVPGSFDPITLGHLDIVRRALACYDRVVLAVMNNDAKSYLFSLEERAELARLATKDMPRVTVVADSGMLVELFDRVGGDAIVKGVRNQKDLAYEQEMAAYNLAHNPKAKTVFLQATPGLDGLSSTKVRAMMAAGQVPEGLLPPAVLSYLVSKGVVKA